MESHEILKKAITPIGAKSVSADMALSTSLIYKWCQSKDYNAGAADNPLDRLARLYDLTHDDTIIRWMCQHADGYFVKNVEETEMTEAVLFEHTQGILKEFSELLQAISISTSDDGQISKNEAVTIRAEWEDLKSVAENFVRCCEAGIFRKKNSEK